MNIPAIIAGASNLKGGENPPFTVYDFKKQYPQFFGTAKGKIKPLIPQEVLNIYIDLAHSSIKQSRYHAGWEMCIGLFIAHFITLYMQSMADPASEAKGAMQAGLAKGLVSSKSVDGVSVSYDYSQTLADLDGWAGWKSTAYGAQLATLAKLYGKGGMYVP